MRFDKPLVPATLERRYKRFLADLSLGAGHTATAHCPNPGSMLGLASTGAAVLLSDRGTRATRRLRFTWEAVRAGRTWVCVNTARANQVALEALRACRIRPLARYSMITPEVRVSVRGLRLGRRLPVRLDEARSRPYVARRDCPGSVTSGRPLASPRLARTRNAPAAMTARAIHNTPQKIGGKKSSRDIA
jgi:DNA-binding sugar fermentation-stimulating protein